MAMQRRRAPACAISTKPVGFDLQIMALLGLSGVHVGTIHLPGKSGGFQSQSVPISSTGPVKG